MGTEAETAAGTAAGAAEAELVTKACILGGKDGAE